MDKIQEIFKFLETDLQKVNDLILEFSRGKSPLIKEISNHLVLSGGKRIRPILLILSSKLCDEKIQNYHNLAAAVELIHSATLLHDDVVDNSMIRRGKKTANAIWDNKASILVGDFMFSIAFQLMVQSNNIKVLDILSKTSSLMADGEVLQLENSSDIEINFEKYIEIISYKTAILFSSSSEIAAINANKSEKERIALKNFGNNLGIIFQIIDDILDYKSEKENFGKEIGDDFFEGKITLPIILAYKNADKKDKEIINNLFQENLINVEKNHKNFKIILNLIEKYDAIEKSYEVALSYKNQALKSLELFEDSIYKNYLIEILNYSFSRKK